LGLKEPTRSGEGGREGWREGEKEEGGREGGRGEGEGGRERRRKGGGGELHLQEAGLKSPTFVLEVG
jgi:hypothetical protein